MHVAGREKKFVSFVLKFLEAVQLELHSTL